MRRRAAALAAALAVGAAGCGGEDPGDVLGETADKLDGVRSGELDLRLMATPGEGRQGVGFELSGPFALGEPGRMPVTRMRYTRVVGETKTSAVLTSTGKEAFVTSDGQTTPVPPEAAESLVVAGGGKGRERRTVADLGLDVGAWIEDAEVEDGPTIDGATTDRVTGRLRAGRAVTDVLAALRRAGAPVPEAGDEVAKTLDEAVRSSRAEILTGREDRILRRIDLTIDLRPAEELEAAVPGGGAVRLTARLDLRRPNSRVRVEAPAG